MEVNRQTLNQREARMTFKTQASAIALAATAVLGASPASAWSLEEAAKPYAGTEVEVLFLDRPGYAAAIKMLPEFEAATGIKINITRCPTRMHLANRCATSWPAAISTSP